MFFENTLEMNLVESFGLYTGAYQKDGLPLVPGRSLPSVRHAQEYISFTRISHPARRPTPARMVYLKDVLPPIHLAATDAAPTENTWCWCSA